MEGAGMSNLWQELRAILKTLSAVALLSSNMHMFMSVPPFFGMYKLSLVRL